MASKPKRNFVEVPASASRAASLFALLLVHRAAEVVTRALVLGLFIIGVPFIYVPMYGLHHHNSSYYVPHPASPLQLLVTGGHRCLVLLGPARQVVATAMALPVVDPSQEHCHENQGAAQEPPLARYTD